MKVIIIIVFLILHLIVNGQISIKTQKATLKNSDKNKVEKYLIKYKSFKFDRKTIIQDLKNNQKTKFLLSVEDDFVRTIELKLNDLRGPNFMLNVMTDSSVINITDLKCNTYKGYTDLGEIARFSIDEDVFNGMVLNSESKEHFFINNLSKFGNGLPKDVFVLYKKEDIIQSNYSHDNDFIEIDKTINNNEAPQNLILKSAPVCDYYLEIATEADFEYYQDFGSDEYSVYREVMSVLNLIEGVYESTFDLRFVVTFQNVWATSSDPYTSTNNSTLLSQFRSEWINNRTGIGRDIAHLFTGKDLDDNIAGVAYRPGEYSLSMNRTEMFETTAHEIGHNLNAAHPASANQTECECGTNTASVMCQGTKDNDLWFCQQSRNEISTYLTSNSADYAIPIQQNLSLNGNVRGFNKYHAREVITSTQVIDDGFIIYQCEEVLLNSGFEIKPASEFEIIIDDTGCY